MSLNIVILAAGQGKRMGSFLPKVLHEVSGKSMICHILDTCINLNPKKIIIVCGHLGEEVKSHVRKYYPVIDNIFFVDQEQQLGTADAVKKSLPYLDKNVKVLVLCGDTPLIKLNTLMNMLNMSVDNNLVLLTTITDNPNGYGRIIRDMANKILKITEEKDANTDEKLIKEINAAVYLFNEKYLNKLLPCINSNNEQHEFYLTDIVDMAVVNKIDIVSISVHTDEVIGVNNKVQLEIVERLYQKQLAISLMENGITLVDKDRIDIRGNLVAGRDCYIDINCIFIGNVKLGNNVKIMSNCVIKDSIISDNTEIKPNCIIEDTIIANNVFIGPFARIRPNTNIASNVNIGNFVEVKKSSIGTGSKINHLTYVGDSIVGNNVNIGAGSVTCNYDGKNKHQTIIGDNVFVGSGSMLVAPLNLGNGSIIGAGSVITKDTPEDELTLARSKQVTVVGWKKKYRNN
jgi:bifunctional UDP-N-acetylglucosamine pyrophosphorylase/glucosamine-1-phosphate N-acetyltransferase